MNAKIFCKIYVEELNSDSEHIWKIFDLVGNNIRDVVRKSKANMNIFDQELKIKLLIWENLLQTVKVGLGWESSDKLVETRVELFDLTLSE